MFATYYPLPLGAFCVVADIIFIKDTILFDIFR